MYQTPTTETGLSVQRHRLTVPIAAAMVLATSLHSADAEPRRALEIIAPSQTVMVGETEAVFEARLTICADGQVDGFVELIFRDGTAVELTPVFAKLQLQGDSVVPSAAAMVYLPEGLAGPAGPGDFSAGTFSPSAVEVGCDIWDFLGPDVQGGSTPGRLQFEAETTHTLTEARCAVDDFGQFASRARIGAERQTVVPFDGSPARNLEPFDFAADIKTGRANRASGIIVAPLSERGGFYEMFFGVLLPHPEQGAQLFSVGVLANPGDPPSPDDMLRATAVQSAANEDCLIWDLINGATGEVNNAAAFDAEGGFKVSPPLK